MAEFQKVMADAGRMCNSYKECKDCIARDCCTARHGTSPFYDCVEFETIVEQWAAEHPVKTNRMVLEEVFPKYAENLSTRCPLADSVDCFGCEHYASDNDDCNFWDEEYKGGERNAAD